MTEDPRQAAARYRLERAGREGRLGEHDQDAARASPPDGSDEERPAPTARQRAAYVETAIQQAMRRGDFDDLPGAGKPLPDLGETHDPDWWIRRKIQTEQLTGLGPPALTLRVEHAEMESRLDALNREEDVRETIADFNRRVVEARRQLLGGPPVVTPTRDVEHEVTAWRERRAAREAAARPADPPEAAGRTRRGWLRRRPPR